MYKQVMWITCKFCMVKCPLIFVSCLKAWHVVLCDGGMIELLNNHGCSYTTLYVHYYHVYEPSDSRLVITSLLDNRLCPVNSDITTEVNRFITNILMCRSV